MTFGRPKTRWAATLAAVAALAALSGCYQRVVSAKGPGTEGYTIHRPASEDVMFKRLDNWIMGDPNQDKKRN
jgi:hypothetical protein